jgi:hypothetical protein
MLSFYERERYSDNYYALEDDFEDLLDVQRKAFPPPFPEELW